MSAVYVKQHYRTLATPVVLKVRGLILLINTALLSAVPNNFVSLYSLLICGQIAKWFISPRSWFINSCIQIYALPFSGINMHFTSQLSLGGSPTIPNIDNNNNQLTHHFLSNYFHQNQLTTKTSILHCPSNLLLQFELPGACLICSISIYTAL